MTDHHQIARLRPEQPEDAAAVAALTTAAFATAAHASGTEAAIVDALRAAGALTLSLVAVTDEGIVGHAAFSPVEISSGAAGWQGLGPLSVDPRWQRRGIGTALVEGGLTTLAARGAAGCVVLGDPAYYGRFGFLSDPGLFYPGVPPLYFQRLVMRGTAPHGAVAYHPAFAAT